MSTVTADNDGGWHPSSFEAGRQACRDQIRAIMTAPALRGKPAATIAAISLAIAAPDLAADDVIGIAVEHIASNEPNHGTARFALLASKSDIPPGAA